VLLNDEIQAAREVTKTSTLRMQTFRTVDFGCLGQADADAVVWYRRPLRRLAPDTEFDVRGLDALPRVDIAYAYAGADGTAIDAFVAAGAKGIVTAGFAPGFVTPAMSAAMEKAVAAGVKVVLSSRAGSGRAARTTRGAKAGFLTADNLTPQKARILLALASPRGGGSRAHLRNLLNGQVSPRLRRGQGLCAGMLPAAPRQDPPARRGGGRA